jgi:DNA-binding transcriptional MerR regulator
MAAEVCVIPILEPTHVDRQTGYRYYSVDQVPTAQVIRRFRELGMPVREVGELVAVTDPDARAALIAHHLERLETQLDQTRAAVVSLRRFLQPDPAPLVVHRRRTEATTVDLATTIHIGPHHDIDVTYAALGTYVSRQALQVAGPVREIYHVGPRDTDDGSQWRTEIGWPIFQTASDPAEDN